MCQLKVFCRTDPRGDTRSAGTPIRQRGLTAEEIYVMLLRSGGSSDRQYKALAWEDLLTHLHTDVSHNRNAGLAGNARLALSLCTSTARGGQATQR